ncbi:hypothetical protein [Streptomyces meridianus]|uniref:Integral membrane protein n=1 Tax=Streptomyces meridianus TaxID=2938945 RepID=A0ABT0X1X2_9ACTN|nr:hypothetical protein [Streptomyces meridianus]MCM2576170.1 hypothetical protein [Streptomyces meridianus]
MSTHPTPPGECAEGGATPARSGPVRRGSVDPVRALMQRHRALCERAVDPLEIAAGLEAHGVTDRTAARFRHRDVFSLAEELYARVPRAAQAPVAPSVPAAARAERDRPGARGLLRAAVYLLPGVLATTPAAALLLLDEADPAVRFAAAAAGLVLVALALRPCLRRGPLRVRRGARSAAPAVCWLLGYALLGDGLLARGLGTAEASVSASSAVLTAALVFAVAPAAWCARWFAVRAHRGLAASRHLDEFASGSRPLVPAAVTLFALALGILLLSAETLRVLALPDDPGEYGRHAVAPAAVAALGILLFVARLLAVHGRPRAVLVGVGAAVAVEASALAVALVSRLPGCEALAAPVRAAVAAYGPAVVPLGACAPAALLLLVLATVLLARASAHSGRPAAWGQSTSRPAARAEPSRDSPMTHHLLGDEER